jgi:hypothetical protein
MSKHNLYITKEVFGQDRSIRRSGFQSRSAVLRHSRALHTIVIKYLSLVLAFLLVAAPLRTALANPGDHNRLGGNGDRGRSDSTGARQVSGAPASGERTATGDQTPLDAIA